MQEDYLRNLDKKNKTGPNRNQKTQGKNERRSRRTYKSVRREEWPHNLVGIKGILHGDQCKIRFRNKVKRDFRKEIL